MYLSAWAMCSLGRHRCVRSQQFTPDMPDQSYTGKVLLQDVAFFPCHEPHHQRCAICLYQGMMNQSRPEKAVPILFSLSLRKTASTEYDLQMVCVICDSHDVKSGFLQWFSIHLKLSSYVRHHYGLSGCQQTISPFPHMQIDAFSWNLPYSHYVMQV